MYRFNLKPTMCFSFPQMPSATVMNMTGYLPKKPFLHCSVPLVPNTINSLLPICFEGFSPGYFKPCNILHIPSCSGLFRHGHVTSAIRLFA